MNINEIEISHNPFIVDTTFLINGHAPADGCILSSYKESRLQLWVESLFDTLKEQFNGESRFRIVFKGVESDWLDIEEAAQIANDKGMTVEMEWIKTTPTEDRLAEVRKLVDEAREHQTLGQYIKNHKKVEESIEEAFNRDFDVYVVATMSSGKSTLINAMLEYDLLPTANEATTATITRITDNKEVSNYFTAKHYDSNNDLVCEEENLTPELLKEWNSLPDSGRIDIEGNICAINKRPDVRLVLTDTPGPNNSQNEAHQRTTMSFIQDSKRNPLILYILNGQQLGTNDDKNLLGLIAETMKNGGKQSKDRFIFVVNKMDAFDSEKESISGVLQRVKSYLVENGISNPQIYPVSANLTRLIRKSSDTQSKKERSDYKAMADCFEEEPSLDMLQYMPITSRVRKSLKEKKYSPLLLSSGLPAVETMIDEHIDKYNFPHRLKRAYDAMSQTIMAGLNETEINRRLDQDERTLVELNKTIERLQQQQQKGFDTAAYKDRLEQEGKELPHETVDQLTKLEGKIGPIIKGIGESFSGHTKVAEYKAKELAKQAEEGLRFHYDKLINEYEQLFQSTQNTIRKDLNREYQRYITELFESVGSLDLPILEGIKTHFASTDLNLLLSEDDIKEDYKREDRTWWNPFTWSRKLILLGKYVDLEAWWKEHVTRLDTDFLELLKSAREKIEGGKTRLVDQYFVFMSREFNLKFDELMDSLKNKITDREVRELAIAEAKELQKWIEDFRFRLNETLAI